MGNGLLVTLLATVRIFTIPGASRWFIKLCTYNDDAAGEDPANAASPMLFSNSIENDDQPSLLVFDLYFPNPSGSCGDGGPYSEDFKVKVSRDDGVSWIVLDSTISTDGIGHRTCTILNHTCLMLALIELVLSIRTVEVIGVMALL